MSEQLSRSGQLLEHHEQVPNIQFGRAPHFDKDVFRKDLGDLTETYRALHARIFGEGSG